MAVLRPGIQVAGGADGVRRRCGLRFWLRDDGRPYVTNAVRLAAAAMLLYAIGIA